MSELRWHPLLSQWVITATHRQDRTFLPPEDYCPLCPTKPGGFPTEVPAETYDIVVFENKFPSLQREPPEPAVPGSALSPVLPARGVCEVLLYRRTTGSRSPPCRSSASPTWPGCGRTARGSWGSGPRIEYVFPFENRGEAVGVTLHHPHGQIYAFPFVPPTVQRELDASKAHHLKHGRCLFCDSLKEELGDGRRVVLEGEAFVAYVPFFARYPYEVYLAPKAHQASLLDLEGTHFFELALVLKGLLMKYTPCSTGRSPT